MPSNQRRIGKLLVVTLAVPLTWICGPTWAQAPGGSDKDVQFNDAGAFAGDDSFQYDKIA